MKNVKVCLIICLVLKLLAIETESRGLPELPSIIDTCFHTSNGHRSCQPISNELNDEENELFKNDQSNDQNDNNDEDNNKGYDSSSHDYDNKFNEISSSIGSDRERKKIKKSKKTIEIMDVDPLIPLLTQIAAKRKQSNKNRKDDPKKNPNLNFQTQGWR